MRWSRWIAIGAIGLVAGACTGDDGANGGPEGADSGDGGRPPEPATTTTHPPADSDEAFQIVEELVAEASEVSDRLFANPQVINDADNPDILRLREIYSPDSPDLEGIVSALEDLAEDGHSISAGESGVLSEEVAFDPIAVGEDVIEFRYCALFDQAKVDVDGLVVDSRATVTLGTGEAHRDDGVWRLSGVDADPDHPRELDPAEVPEDVRFCEEIYGQEGM